MTGLVFLRRCAGLLAAALLLADAAPALAQVGATPPATAPGIGGALLPHDLSPWRMFLSADSVVKSVLVGLALASVVTWTVWLAKSIELKRAERKATQVLATVEQARRLVFEQRKLAGDGKALVDAALAEIAQSGGIQEAQAGLQDRVASRLQRIEAAAGRRMMRGTGVLATIGSVGPFIGLFGTVWGIMNSFIGISQSQTTNLAVVAPGIAEALLATAVGLVAAIPAVVIYNLFARAIGGYRARLTDISAALLRSVSREMDRPLSAPGMILRPAAE